MQEQLIAGADEAGRGPLAGPVIAREGTNYGEAELSLQDKKDQLFYALTSGRACAMR